MIDALIVIVHSHGQGLLCQVLTDDEFVQIFINLFRGRWRLPVWSSYSRLSRTEFRFCSSCVGLFRVIFGQDNEEVRAFVALDEPRGRHELVDVLARRAALGADLKEERKWVKEVIY